MAYVYRTVSTSAERPASPDPLSSGARHEIAAWFARFLFDAQLSLQLGIGALRRTFLRPATITILDIPAEPDQQQRLNTGAETSVKPLTPLP